MYMPSVCKTIAPVPGSRRKNNLRCCDKLCSTSGLLRWQSFKDIIRTLLDPTLPDYVSFNLCTGFAGREAFFRRLPTAAYDFLHWVRKKEILVFFIKKKIPNTKYLIQFLDAFVLNVGFAKIILYHSEVCWQEYPLEGSLRFFPSEAKDLKTRQHQPPTTTCCLCGARGWIREFSLYGA